ncbi:MAG: 3-deoxy-8-phosphooctulonate synthase [Chlamydiae bacterium]|nr:3-deoxy-8-phosphooctulonate synthase [Chlamydiota bacterium]
MAKICSIQNIPVGQGQPFVVISGPCIIESEAHTLACAEALVKLSEKLGIPLIFKASYDKANRSSIHSFRGPGLEKGLKILEKVKKTFCLPVTTDIHEPSHAKPVAEVCDLLQIPAFLCRQTDLLLAAAATKKPVNIKKGQFLAPWDMRNVVDKFLAMDNDKIILTDRGTCFGYNNLVSDMRSLIVLQEFGYPVCFDASHSAQLPGGLGDQTGGQRHYIPTLAKAAIAAGAHLLFIESHPNPAEAKSDATTVMPYDSLEKLLTELKKLHSLILSFSC